MEILHALLFEFTHTGPISLVDKVILMAKMVLHLLDSDIKINVSELSREYGISRETLYDWGHKSVTILGMGCIPDQPGCKGKPVEPEEVSELKKQVKELQQENEGLRSRVEALKEKVASLTVNLKEMVDKAIVTLRLSGKVSYRGIEECIELIFGVHVPPYIIKEKLNDAANKAEGILPRLLSSIKAKFISLDEIYLKEQGRRIYGLLVTELGSRAIISLTRATNRTSDTWLETLKKIPQLKENLQGIATDLARAFPALIRKLKDAWQKKSLLHQLCNVHAFRRLLELKKLALQPYKKAKERYQNAKKALKKKPNCPDMLLELWSAQQLRDFHWRMSRHVLALTTQLIKALSKPTRQAAEAALDQTLAQIALLPIDYQPWGTKVTKFINSYRDKLLLHYDFLGLEWTTNSCEGAFSVLRRFVNVYKSFPSQESVEQFFTLFVLYYNLKPQRYADGTVMSPFEKAGVNVEGNYLYYLGYSTPKIISYSKLAAQASSLKLSTEFNHLATPA